MLLSAIIDIIRYDLTTRTIMTINTTPSLPSHHPCLLKSEDDTTFSPKSIVLLDVLASSFFLFFLKQVYYVHTLDCIVKVDSRFQHTSCLSEINFGIGLVLKEARCSDTNNKARSLALTYEIIFSTKSSSFLCGWSCAQLGHRW